jgi:hypothetical protein
MVCRQTVVNAPAAAPSIKDERAPIPVWVPRGTGLALERAAIAAHARPGQLARRMLLDGLRASGFELGVRDDVSYERSNFG